MSEVKMNTLIEVNREKEDTVFPLLKTQNFVNHQHNSVNMITNQQEFLPTTITFSNINYTVGNEKLQSKVLPPWNANVLSFWKSTLHKQILTDVSGIFPPGMNAILGPTGCGKSTLLDILADRKDRRGLSGTVLLSGQPRPSYFKYAIGYVTQDDIISETLTVRENLLFSANIRLPRSINMYERIERVDQVIHDLDLLSCANTMIGTDFVRGVSGGEKKRTSIGMELVLSPNVLFLDEPTTGLDASTAQNIMTYLYSLSKQGRTIIFSIHQPRYSIFKLFDTVLFLSSGYNIYLGSPLEVLPYFASLGFTCEEHNNPADFVLDILIESSTHSANELRAAYLQSNIAERVRNEMQDNQYNGLLKHHTLPKYRTELYYIAERTFCNALRHPGLVISQVISVIIYGLFTGLIFKQLERTIDPGVYNRFGAIFFIVSCQALSAMSALEPLIKERALFIHEHVSGYYRVSSFFLSKLMIDLPLVHLIPCLIYALITYTLTDLHRSTGRFWFFILTNLMAKIFGAAMCYFVAASTASFGVALVMVVSSNVTMMLFSGFLIALGSIVPFLRWIQWISVFRYASNALAINEFRNLTLCFSSESDICITKGEEILTRRQIPHETTWDLWQNILALSAIILTFFLMAYMQLLRMKKFQ
ncbi:unnamed protein product [Adineta ricciae]|uniref:ABC transporter domain-containing protein n=2 Tax=Adineta ricciae TaxID=249248 RepID=A0A815X0K9_ADIRI|nr:unnamed protein product [Adineta ricciae]